MWHAIRNPEVTETAELDIPEANSSYLPWTLSFVWFPLLQARSSNIANSATCVALQYTLVILFTY